MSTLTPDTLHDLGYVRYCTTRSAGLPAAGGEGGRRAWALRASRSSSTRASFSSSAAAAARRGQWHSAASGGEATARSDGDKRGEEEGG